MKYTAPRSPASATTHERSRAPQAALHRFVLGSLTRRAIVLRPASKPPHGYASHANVRMNWRIADQRNSKNRRRRHDRKKSCTRSRAAGGVAVDELPRQAEHEACAVAALDWIGEPVPAVDAPALGRAPALGARRLSCTAYRMPYDSAWRLAIGNGTRGHELVPRGACAFSSQGGAGSSSTGLRESLGFRGRHVRLLHSCCLDRSVAALVRRQADERDLWLRLPVAARRVHGRGVGWGGWFHHHRGARAHQSVGRHLGYHARGSSSVWWSRLSSGWPSQPARQSPATQSCC